MPYTVEFKTSARKVFDSLQGAIQTRISAVVDDLEENPRPSGCKKLKGRDNTYRIRVGDYRIVYEVHDAVLFVLVIGVGHRSKVYH